jgi:hypothetical protein
MNVQKLHTIVIIMLTVPIQKDPLSVLARLDIKEMVQHVMVRVFFIYSYFC